MEVWNNSFGGSETICSHSLSTHSILFGHTDQLESLKEIMTTAFNINPQPQAKAPIHSFGIWGRTAPFKRRRGEKSNDTKEYASVSFLLTVRIVTSRVPTSLGTNHRIPLIRLHIYRPDPMVINQPSHPRLRFLN